MKTSQNTTFPFSGCGIAGIIYQEQEIEKDSARNINKFKKIIDSLRHRGPDGEGMWENKNIVLGHRRLSIQDLSNNGKQPMTRDHLTITYNGEVYNFKEIRETLKQKGVIFTSHTDTEVVLRAYQQWGSAALEKLNGMFAIAIWDDKEKTLFLARDRIGVKPLYYYQDSSLFMFGSEVQALMHSQYISPEINWETVYQQVFFEVMYDYDTARTMVKGIQMLLPGHFLEVSLNGQTKITKYWDLPNDKIEQNITTKELIKNFQELMMDSIKLRLISDVPVATFLSGGIDSSIINALAARLVIKDKLTAITTEYHGEGFDHISETVSQDLKFSCMVANLLKDKITHKIIQVNPIEINLEAIDRIIDLAIIPGDIRHFSIYANYHAIQQNKFKVVLNGQGADELMGGYVFSSFFKRIVSMMSLSKIDTIAIENAAHQNPRYTFLQDEVLISGKSNFVNLYNFFHSFDGNLIEKAHRFHMKTLLQWILKFEDLLSMSMGIECRLPFLDYRIIEWAFRIPFTMHIQMEAGFGKALLRSAAKDWLPPDIINRPKQAFPYPNEEKALAVLRNIFYEYNDEILNSNVINRVFKIIPLYQGLSNLNSHELWRIIALWRWEKKLLSFGSV